MSPVPPPARSAVYTESWDDDSFDIDPNATLAPASSPSSSSSSSSPQPASHRRKTSSIGHGHVQSPLRQSHLSLKTHQPKDEEDDDLDFDLPDSFPALSSPRLAPTSRNTTASSSMSIRNLPAQVIGKGPTGIGTVTRLGGKGGPSVPSVTVLARSKAIEKAWEKDVDFDSLEGEDMDEPLALGKRLSLSPPKRRIMPGPDALDDIDLDHDDEATLKAGATIKAMLPPRKKPVEDEMETDFVLPLNVKNLTLATASHHHPRLPRLPHSPSTSSGKKSGTFSWDDSPKRRSETSVTSLTDTSKVVKEKDADVFNEEEDMEDGLVIPSGTFFSSGRAKELNKILDRKRRAPPQPSHRRQGTDETFRTGDDSIEDGLVFENPRADLSRKRLDRAVKARTPNSLLNKKTPKGGAAREARERAWEKQREQGWGRHVPSQPLPGSGQRAQSSLGFTGRSHSSGATGLKDLALGPARRADGTPQDATISRARMHSMAMLPPPIPESRDAVPATPSSRLRHQKSHYHMPLQSPSLARKPSLASLQDAMSSGVLPPVPAVPQTLSKLPTPPESSGRYHHSTSRLTMPTSSSRAKSRPPLQNVFPKTEFTASSSASSIASSSREPLPRSKSGKGSWGRDQVVPSTMSVPRKARKWDGSELDGIEDIPVEGRGSGSFGRSKSRKALDMQAMGSKTFSEQINEAEKKRLAPRNKPRIGRRMPALISHKGRNDKVIVVGDMTFNPRTQRWEGNEALLRDFDPPTAPSVRPALITHYTGSSLGGVKSPTGPGVGTGTVRIVGNMMFDPEKMCWVSTLAPEDDEPDPFEGMADDEDEDAGGTITRATAKRFVAIGSHIPSSTHSSTPGFKASQSSSVLSQQAWSSRMASESSLSAISWDDRIREEAVKIPEELVEECKEADERHKKEMRGWLIRGSGTDADKRDRERREEKRLWEIRILATT